MTTAQSCRGANQQLTFNKGIQVGSYRTPADELIWINAFIWHVYVCRLRKFCSAPHLMLPILDQQPDQAGDGHESSGELKELELRVQALVEQGLLRMDRTPSGELVLQVVQRESQRGQHRSVVLTNQLHLFFNILRSFLPEVVTVYAARQDFI